MKIKDLENKKILILGFAREGRDTLSFLKKHFPKKIIGISDKIDFLQPKLTQKYTGDDYLKAIKNYEVVIKSPGIPYKVLPENSISKITSQTEIFFDNCAGKIIGITGTKGKSTTSSLIYEILKSAGKKVSLIGNIENPVLSYLDKAKKEDWFVYELSSHQLYNLKQGPSVGVFLNIYPEHLDYYNNFNDYAKAKANITLNQTKDDYIIYNSNDKLVTSFVKKSKAKKIPISGEYYELDKNAARKVGKILKVSSKTIEKTINKFNGLEHRMELVGEYKGITFYNDSLATIPQATILAIRSIKKDLETIILGGFDRGLNFKELAQEILKSNIKTIILFPTTGEKILKEISKIDKNKKIKYFSVDNMKEAVRLCFENTLKGKICILSTASPSFGIFKDYKERGNLFKKYVKELAR